MSETTSENQNQDLKIESEKIEFLNLEEAIKEKRPNQENNFQEIQKPQEKQEEEKDIENVKEKITFAGKINSSEKQYLENIIKEQKISIEKLRTLIQKKEQELKLLEKKKDTPS